MNVQIHKIAIALFNACLLSGCSSSASGLLQAGDPAACADDYVRNQVALIIKQNATLPANNGFIENYARLREEWQENITLSLENITSTDVDKENQKIICNAKVLITSANPRLQKHSILSYQASRNLATNDGVIVALDSSAPSMALTDLYREVAAPVLELARGAKLADCEQKGGAMCDFEAGPSYM